MPDKPAGSSGGASPTGGRPRIPRDAFVARVVPDPANLDAKSPRVLRGYVGDSDEAGYTRVYCGSLLEVYADVRDDDILHYEASSGGQEHTLWVKTDAQVKHGRRGAAKGEAASFADGPLVKDYAGGTGTGGGTGSGRVGVTGWQGCVQITLVTYAGCPTHNPLLCSWICPTAPGVCPPSVGCPPTPTLDCPLQAGGANAARAAAAPVQNTTATLCTQVGCAPVGTAATICTHYGSCQTHTTATVCTHYGSCPHVSAATVCTQLCPQPSIATLCTYQPACTLGFTCTAIGCR